MVVQFILSPPEDSSSDWTNTVATTDVCMRLVVEFKWLWLNYIDEQWDTKTLLPKKTFKQIKFIYRGQEKESE